MGRASVVQEPKRRAHSKRGSQGAKIASTKATYGHRSTSSTDRTSGDALQLYNNEHTIPSSMPNRHSRETDLLGIGGQFTGTGQ
ncbi:hypothetical protein O1611_g791 [Lasiodiplodia mahajangana]|uniref:Uncharacterized protein n=1 Tax=Lasiodiplodia mahajangana TaxID=1108764 RepID=A0ACC2JZI3_9PEZI|nr:hypothetical protein O1611_g791 [Lasiodiplodia mahajangana]